MAPVGVLAVRPACARRKVLENVESFSAMNIFSSALGEDCPMIQLELPSPGVLFLMPGRTAVSFYR
ncbi:hypothetical protein A6U98_21395 [Rhizobium sp. WYCCWR10014]|jgi:hypothetical protein|nr:hypothetical protein A6U98_21395 [Rhizobium sp. WYCCWR10014]